MIASATGALYTAGIGAGGLGALFGGLAAWRTRGLASERANWEAVGRAWARENAALRRECQLLRAALRRAIEQLRNRDTERSSQEP